MDTSTVLLRLEGPVQVWGTSGGYWESRPTGPRPTKSAIIGLTANALGRDYDDDISDLAACRYAVRADRPGHLTKDLQTVGGGSFPLDQATAQHPDLRGALQGHLDDDAPWYWHQDWYWQRRWYQPLYRYEVPRRPRRLPDGTRIAGWSDKERGPLRRFQTFLADAAFLASLTGPTPLIKKVEHALQHPARPLYLGRRSCPPSQYVYYALLPGDQHTTWPDTQPRLPRATPGPLTAWTEDTTGPLHYEQPGPGRTYTALPLTSRTTTPPDSETENEPW